MFLNCSDFPIDKLLVIFQYLQEKLQQFRDNKLLLGVAQAAKNYFDCGSNFKKLAFLILQFYDAAKTAKKRLLKQTELRE